MSISGAPQAGKVTISDLAHRLGISKASVSYALNGQSGVSEATRARVLALAGELGWYPSSSARALSHSRTDSVGIVLFETLNKLAPNRST
ncbi:LacI family DNA-binding transcriptional regulator [Arthrobacter alpinus]|nr:LacI family DNA-binding transcriptional regulator [Arthrobacter alpinus]